MSIRPAFESTKAGFDSIGDMGSGDKF
jgi:hypothetical protein